MKDYLFNQNVLIIFSVLSTLTCLLFITNTFKNSRRQKFSRPKILLGVAVALAIFIAEVVAISTNFGLQNTPAAAYYITLIANLLIVFSILQWRRSKKTSGFGLLAFVSTFILLCLVINNYYQYYPTFGSLFTASYTRSDQISTLT